MFKKRNSVLRNALPLVLAMPSLLHAAALEEVIVTAQKTLESVQDVPISISAFTSTGLEDAGIRSSDELSVISPGLQFGRQVGNATPFIRGVGTSNTSIGDESSIATYVDGVYYVSFTAAVVSFNNLERVEVLKGPQGTLFGRNATGGLIHYITKDPQQQTSASLKLSYGNYDTSGLNFYGTTGITENLAADLAIFYEDQAEGFGENINSGKEINKAKTTAARSKWLLTPSSDTNITLALDYTEGKSSIAISLTPAQGSIGFGGAAYTGNWWDINSNLEPIVDNYNWGAALTADHNISDAMNFISVTAYRYSSELQVIDQDGTPTPIVDAPLDTHTGSFSQEFRLNWDDGQALRWMLGVFYFQADAAYEPFATSGLGVQGLTGGLASSMTANVEQNTKSYAIFGQSTYAFTDDLNLTLGLRYTRDEREIIGEGTHLFTGFNQTGTMIPLPGSENDKSWNKLTWRLALDYQITDSTMVYGSYSRGFKSGVFNTIVPTDPAVNPETLDAYEVGFKADLLDSALRWNTSFFYYQYDDLQIQRLNGGFTQLLNAAQSTTSGLESSLDFAVSDHLTLVSGVAFLQAEFDSFPVAPITTPNPTPPFFGNAVSEGEVKGNDVIRSPRWTGNLGVIYNYETSMGVIDASAYYYYNDGFSWEPDNRFQQDSYSTVNATATWTLPSKNWVFGVYGRNLTNEEYAYFGTGGQLGDLYSAAPPRTYGVSVEYKLD